MYAKQVLCRAVGCICLLLLVAVVPACRKGTAPDGKHAPPEWTESSLSFSPSRKIQEGISPALASDHETGTLYLAFFSAENYKSATTPEEHIFVCTSSDGGKTWAQSGSIPTMVAYGVWGFDFQRYMGRLYLIWTSFDEGRKKILLTTAADGDRAFSQPVEVNSPLAGQRRNPVIATDGSNTYAAWLDERQRDSRVYFSASIDAGKTWSEDVSLEQHPGNRAARSGTPVLAISREGAVHCCFPCLWKSAEGRMLGTLYHAVSSDRGKTWESHIAYPKLALMELDVAVTPDEPQTLYVAAVAVTAALKLSAGGIETEDHVYLFKSVDGGKTWDKGVWIDDQVGAKRRPRIRLAGKRIVVAWDDQGRNGLYVTVSEDGGKTWSRNVRVADRSHVGITEFSFQLLGDRMVLVWGDVVKGQGDSLYLVEGSFK